jgi:preprotein translocase subunit SecE
MDHASKEIAVIKKAVTTPEKKEKKEYRIVRYLKEVRAELRKVVWPSRRNTLNLTGIVLGVTASMSVLLGVIDWLLSKLFALIIG